MKIKKYAMALLVPILILSCGTDSKKRTFLPESTGAVNSLMVVMDNNLWRGAVGDTLRSIFAQPSLGLSPIQPIFSITQIPPSVFDGGVTHSRSILYVQKDSISLAHVKTDVYAKPQKVAVVKGRTNEELTKNLDSIQEMAINAFKANEMKEMQRRFTRSLNKEDALQEEFGISLNMPSVYKVGKREDNFVWIDRQIPKGTMNVIVYTMPEDTFKNDSTFVADIMKMRDSIGKKYVPGPYEDTYMITEKAFSPYVFPATVNDKKAVEVRGTWEINGYPMAGPFLTYIINDKEHNRKLVLEGFVFAPSTVKRDYIFELEAILRSVKWQ